MARPLNLAPTRSSSVINKKVQKFIKDSSSKGSPWAAYYALTEAHTPLIVEKEFKGKSSHGAYGDTILQMDNMVGRVLDTLRDAGKHQASTKLEAMLAACSILLEVLI